MVLCCWLRNARLFFDGGGLLWKMKEHQTEFVVSWWTKAGSSNAGSCHCEPREILCSRRHGFPSCFISEFFSCWTREYIYIYIYRTRRKTLKHKLESIKFWRNFCEANYKNIVECASAWFSFQSGSIFGNQERKIQRACRTVCQTVLKMRRMKKNASVVDRCWPKVLRFFS